MRKILALTAILLCCVTFVFASGAEEVAETAATVAEDGAIGGTLTIWDHNVSFEQPLKDVVEGFNKIYPDVDVEIQIKADQYYNILQTAIQAGEAPDLFWTNGTATTNLEAYARQGLLMDLTGKVDLSLYDGTNATSLIRVDGKLYATPTAEVGGRTVFYNKDIFEECGIAIPTSFSEFDADLAILQDAGYIPVTFNATDSWNVLFIFEPVLAAMHLDYLDEFFANGTVKMNDPRVVDTYNKLLEWADKDYFGKTYLGVSSGGSLLALTKGQAAMTIGGTWNLSRITKNNPELNLGAFSIPTEDGTRPFVGTSSCGYSVSSSTENVAAALAFENYFTTAEAQTLWLNANDGIPCTTAVKVSNPVVNEVADFDVQTISYYDIMGFIEGDGDSPRQIWEEDQTKIFTGDLSVQDFVDEIQNLCK